VVTDSERAPNLLKHALWLEYFTITWNVLEAVVAISAGVVAGSIALVGFGLDSTIESFAASVVIWQLRGRQGKERERRALKLIAITFFVLAAYVVLESARDLFTSSEAETSAAGVVLAIVSIFVMPTLALAKKRLARRMGSPVLSADAAETFLCAWLSVILLAGLVLNATVGLWWADPLAALGIAWLAFREGREAWSGDADEE
jgi:divalent metal cation (Fe/Co/Zn/Cd) transporter